MYEGKVCTSVWRDKCPWKTVSFPTRDRGKLLPKKNTYIKHIYLSEISKSRFVPNSEIFFFISIGTMGLAGFWKEHLRPSCIFWSSFLLYLQMAWHNQPIDVLCLVNSAFVHSPQSGLETEVELPVTWGQLLRKLSDVWQFELWAELLPSGMPMLSAQSSKAGDICTQWPSWLAWHNSPVGWWGWESRLTCPAYLHFSNLRAWMCLRPSKNRLT